MSKSKSHKDFPPIEFNLTNFGPIKSGHIIVKPLTIFVGPNNAGKSYTAMLLHAFFDFITKRDASFYIFSRLIDDKTFDYRKTINRLKSTNTILQKLENQIRDLKKNKPLTISDEIVYEVVNKILIEKRYKEFLMEEISIAFSCKLDDLIKYGSKSFKFSIDYNNLNLKFKHSKNRTNLTSKYPSLFPEISDDESEMVMIKFHIKKTSKEKYQLYFLDERNKEYKYPNHKVIDPFMSVVEMIMEIFSFILFSDIKTNSYYLPAARSGILHGYKSLTASFFQNIRYAGVRPFNIPKLAISADFIQKLLELDDREKSDFYEFTRKFERELINGEILLKSKDKESVPEIIFQSKKHEIPLYRAASSVSELAPIFLYLKYYVKKGDILIIEEPESHLHPANQLKLAKFIARLIREGVRVLITTHSDWFLEQFNNFMLLSKIPEKNRIKKYNYSENDYLKYDEIAVYVFNLINGETEIKEIKISEKDGISQEEFLKINESLYDETVKLREELFDE